RAGLPGRLGFAGPAMPLLAGCPAADHSGTGHSPTAAFGRCVRVAPVRRAVISSPADPTVSLSSGGILVKRSILALALATYAVVLLAHPSAAQTLAASKPPAAPVKPVSATNPDDKGASSQPAAPAKTATPETATSTGAAAAKQAAAESTKAVTPAPAKSATAEPAKPAVVDSVALLERAVAKDSTKFDNLYRPGVLYLDRDRVHEAIRVLHKAHTLRPKYHRVLVILAA